MNAADEIAAVRARLPYFDRRALSQAWFSAFHLAAGGPSASVKHAFAISEVASDGRLPHALRRPCPARALPLAEGAPVHSRGLTAGGNAIPAGLRRPKGSSERIAAARRYPPVHASFTLAIEGARVQILLRRDGPVLHVVALCTRRHLELVRRALACADFALRAQGADVRSSLRAVEPAE